MVVGCSWTSFFFLISLPQLLFSIVVESFVFGRRSTPTTQQHQQRQRCSAAAVVSPSSLALPSFVNQNRMVATTMTSLFAGQKDEEETTKKAVAVDEEDIPRVNLLELLSTCVDAAGRGCDAIRRVQKEQREDAEEEGGGGFEVDYKIDGDPRSALTAADVAAQEAIVDALTKRWPCLTIVGEEDIDVVRDEECTLVDGSAEEEDGGGLRKDLCYNDNGDDGETDAGNSAAAAREEAPALDRITVFVDPLDGTREFVEGRLQNVQTLIGIAVDGVAVAGAVGIPFWGYKNNAGDKTSSSSSSPAIVYGLVGMGRLAVYHPIDGTTSSSTTTFSNGGKDEGQTTTTTSSRDRLLLVAGDTNDPVLMDAYRAVSDAAAGEAAPSGGGCDRELMGGTGTKILAVAENRADIAVMNFKSSRWDTCATEALLRTTGGRVTDLFGCPIVHRSEIMPPDTSYLNCMGVVASAPRASDVHKAVCQAMRRNPGALSKLLGYGLTEEQAEKAAAATTAANDDDDDDNDDAVVRVLKKRREIQTRGLIS